MDGQHDHPSLEQRLDAVEDSAQGQGFAVEELYRRVEALEGAEPSPEPIPEPDPEPSPAPDPDPVPPADPPEPASGISYLAPANPIFSDGPDGLTLELDIPDGARISGEVSFTLCALTSRGDNRKPVPDGIKWRLLVDGVPMSLPLDTSRLEDGVYAIGPQLIEPSDKVHCRVKPLVVNNSQAPAVHLNQPLCLTDETSKNNGQLAFMRADLKKPFASPLPYYPERMVSPKTAEERAFLESEAVWCVEGLCHQPTILYGLEPWPMLNEHGDLFVGYYNTRLAPTSIESAPFVGMEPAFDGPRGICRLSPYSTLTASHEPGWGYNGSDAAGRVVKINPGAQGDEDMIRTIFGPRSVPDRYQTDWRARNRNSNPAIRGIDLEKRLEKGEKEFVGTRPQTMLKGSEAIWPEPTDPINCFWISDTGNDRIVMLNKDHLEDEIPLKGVTWTHCCFRDREFGILLHACNPEGVWEIRTDRSMRLVVPRPYAFAIHGKDSKTAPASSRKYILDQFGAIIELDPATGDYREVLPPNKDRLEPFAFLDIDVKGNIGRKNRLYWSFYHGVSSSTGVYYADPGEWVRHSFHLNQHPVFSIEDTFGHYGWGFCISHHVSSEFLAVGSANSSWHICRAYLGQQPDRLISQRHAYDLPGYREGRDLFYGGYKSARAPWRDRQAGLSHLMGEQGHSPIGYGVDRYRGLSIGDIADRLTEEGAAHPDWSAEDTRNVATYIWTMMTHPHFA